MDGADSDRKRSGFRSRTPVEETRTILKDALSHTLESTQVDLEVADGRVLAEPIVAARDVPHYDRAAMDGYAVKASDTFGASERSPEVVEVGEGRVKPGTAVRVHTGSEVPEGGDAVVMIEHVEALEATGDLEVKDAVAEGENVAPAGEDVEAGTTLYEPGHRLRPSDLGLLRSVGLEEVEVRERPTVGVIPTGEELVEADPEPGEVIETNGLTISRMVQRWGGQATYRDVVTDDVDALRVAIERDLTKDVVVTTGGSSVGERDLLPEVIDELGEVLVHGVALKPGHPVCLGIVEDTPVLALPGYPVACIVNAVQFLRPVLRWLEGTEPEPHPTVEARLDRKIPSEPGTRTFARVALEEQDGERVAVPTRASGSGVLSSVALADGWVVVEDSREGIPEGERVQVENWEPSV
ncbi:molybdopterin molybdotransferase MoeA [Natrialbaceae archaeon A-gly3]